MSQCILGPPILLLIFKYWVSQGFSGGSDSKESACNAGDLGSIPGLGRSPGEGNGYHSSTVAWRIPWTEEPGRLQSMGLQESDTTQQLKGESYSVRSRAKLGCCSGRQLKSPGQKGNVHNSHGLDVGPEVRNWSSFLIQGIIFKSIACSSIEGWTTGH